MNEKLIGKKIITKVDLKNSLAFFPKGSKGVIIKHSNRFGSEIKFENGIKISHVKKYKYFFDGEENKISIHEKIMKIF